MDYLLLGKSEINGIAIVILKISDCIHKTKVAEAEAMQVTREYISNNVTSAFVKNFDDKTLLFIN